MSVPARLPAVLSVGPDHRHASHLLTVGVDRIAVGRDLGHDPFEVGRHFVEVGTKPLQIRGERDADRRAEDRLRKDASDLRPRRRPRPSGRACRLPCLPYGSRALPRSAGAASWLPLRGRACRWQPCGRCQLTSPCRRSRPAGRWRRLRRHSPVDDPLHAVAHLPDAIGDRIAVHELEENHRDERDAADPSWNCRALLLVLVASVTYSSTRLPPSARRCSRHLPAARPRHRSRHRSRRSLLLVHWFRPCASDRPGWPGTRLSRRPRRCRPRLEHPLAWPRLQYASPSVSRAIAALMISTRSGCIRPSPRSMMVSIAAKTML